METLILAAAGFAEQSPAQLQQEEFAVLVTLILVFVSGLSCIVALWALMYRRSLRKRQITLQSLFVLVALFAFGLRVFMFLAGLIRDLHWL